MPLSGFRKYILGMGQRLLSVTCVQHVDPRRADMAARMTLQLCSNKLLMEFSQKNAFKWFVCLGGSEGKRILPWTSWKQRSNLFDHHRGLSKESAYFVLQLSNQKKTGKTLCTVRFLVKFWPGKSSCVFINVYSAHLGNNFLAVFRP